VCGGGGLVGASFATTCFLTPQIDRICNFFVIEPGPSEGELYMSLLSPSSLCYLTTKKKKCNSRVSSAARLLARFSALTALDDRHDTLASR